MTTYYVDPSAAGKVVTGATKANPCVVTCVGHGFSNGDKVTFQNIGGMTQLNWAGTNTYTVANKTDDTFELSGIDSSAYGNYTTGGTAHNGEGSWATAWHTLAIALYIQPASGDIIYCRKSGGGAGETTTGVLSCASSGSNGSGPIKVVGCNAAGNVDGTRYVIDANNGDFDIIDFAGFDFWWWENIEVKNNGGTAQTGWYSSGATSECHIFVNCCANNCTGSGFSVGSNIQHSYFFRCVSYANTLHGFSGYSYNYFFFCAAHTNTGDGFNVRGGALLYGCISHDNTDDGVELGFGIGIRLINCVLDSNGDDGFLAIATTTNDTNCLIGCRITNHSTAGSNGLITLDEMCIVGWSYFEDNDDNIAGASHDAAPNATFQYIPNADGTTTNVEDGADTDEGYVDRANNDFSTRYVDGTDPSLRRTAITIPWS